MRSTLVHALLLSSAFGCSGGDRDTAWSSAGAAAFAGSSSAAGASATAGSFAASGGRGEITNGGSSGPNEAGSGPSIPGSAGAAGQGTSGGTGSAGAVASGGTNGNGAAGGTGSSCDPSVTSKNRIGVAAALDGLFVDKKVSTIDQYWADPYLQHNPVAKSGVATFKSLMSSFVTSAGFSYQRLRTLADCDLVVVQGKYSGTGVIFDMFRMKDGKLMEHWDSDSNQASDSGGSTLVAEGSSPQNRAQVLSFIQRVLIDGDHAAATQLLSPTFVEHRSGSGSGPNAFIDHVTKSNVSFTKVHHIIADGNYVFTLSEGKLGSAGYGFYDLFRLEAGAIVEHWDSRRSVPASTASGLDIF
jgi:predicted SnoaL-like aldol condensation-catalyzing enzyme